MENTILGYLTSELDKFRTEEKQLHDLIVFVQNNLLLLNKTKKNKGNDLFELLSDKIVDVNGIVIYLKHSIRKFIIQEANEIEKEKEKEREIEIEIYVEEKIKSIICKPLNFGILDDLEKEKYKNLDSKEEITKINKQLIELLINEKYEEFFKLKSVLMYLENLKN
jgi:hypothetical protein